MRNSGACFGSAWPEVLWISSASNSQLSGSKQRGVLAAHKKPCAPCKVAINRPDYFSSVNAKITTVRLITLHKTHEETVEKNVKVNSDKF